MPTESEWTAWIKGYFEMERRENARILKEREEENAKYPRMETSWESYRILEQERQLGRDVNIPNGRSNDKMGETRLTEDSIARRIMID